MHKSAYGWTVDLGAFAAALPETFLKFKNILDSCDFLLLSKLIRVDLKSRVFIR